MGKNDESTSKRKDTSLSNLKVTPPINQTQKNDEEGDAMEYTEAIAKRPLPSSDEEESSLDEKSSSAKRGRSYHVEQCSLAVTLDTRNVVSESQNSETYTVVQQSKPKRPQHKPQKDDKPPVPPPKPSAVKTSNRYSVITPPNSA